MAQNERMEKFDIAKGIGILCVIIGHLSWFPISQIIYTFHMPLFFLIAGYFFRQKGTLCQFCVGKAKRLLIPYYLIAAVLILLKLILYGAPSAIKCVCQAVYASGLDSNKTLTGVGQIGAIWFLWAMFWALLFMRIILTKKNIIVQCVFVMVLFLVSYISAEFIWLPLDIQVGGCAVYYVYMGYLWHRYEEKLKIYLRWLPLAGALAIAYLVLGGFSINMVACRYDYPIVSLPFSLLVCSVVIYFSGLISNRKYGKKFFLFCGQNSIIILGLHLIDLNNFDWTFAYEWFGKYDISVTVQNIAMACMKIAFCAICTFIFVKIKENLRRLQANEAGYI